MGALKKFNSRTELSQLDLLNNSTRGGFKLCAEITGGGSRAEEGALQDQKGSLFYRLLIFQILFSMSSFNFLPLLKCPSPLLLHEFTH